MQVLASAHGGNVKIWDTRMATETHHITAHTSSIYSLDWSYTTPDEFTTAAPSALDQTVKIWSLASPREPKGSMRGDHVCRARYVHVS